MALPLCIHFMLFIFKKKTHSIHGTTHLPTKHKHKHRNKLRSVAGTLRNSPLLTSQQRVFIQYFTGHQNIPYPYLTLLISVYHYHNESQINPLQSISWPLMPLQQSEYDLTRPQSYLIPLHVPTKNIHDSLLPLCVLEV